MKAVSPATEKLESTRRDLGGYALKVVYEHYLTLVPNVWFFFFKDNLKKVMEGMVVEACNSRTQEANSEKSAITYRSAWFT